MNRLASIGRPVFVRTGGKLSLFPMFKKGLGVDLQAPLLFQEGLGVVRFKENA
jgi:hypothetical protein